MARSHRQEDNRTPARQPLPSGGSAGIKVVRLVNVGTEKQTTATALVLKVSYASPESEEDPPYGVAVVVDETEEEIIVANPRGNFLEVGMIYFAFLVSGIWLIDNQSVFQDFMGE